YICTNTKVMTYEEAIETRDKYRYLVGRTFNSSGSILTISRVIAAPELEGKPNEYRIDFSDSELLAISLAHPLFVYVVTNPVPGFNAWVKLDEFLKKHPETAVQ